MRNGGQVNCMVGDYAMGMSLRDLLLFMDRLVKDNGNRNGGALCESALESSFSRIDYELYDEEFQEDEAQIETAARFEIKPNVDVFSDWRVFQIDCTDGSYIYYKHLPSGEGKCHRIDIGIVDAALARLRIELLRLYDEQNLSL